MNESEWHENDSYAQSTKNHYNKPPMKTLSKAERAVMLKSLLFGSIISADNDEFTEEVKQEVIERHKEEDHYGSMISSQINWEYVLEPLGEVAEWAAKIMKSGE